MSTKMIYTVKLDTVKFSSGKILFKSSRWMILMDDILLKFQPNCTINGKKHKYFFIDP